MLDYHPPINSFCKCKITDLSFVVVYMCKHDFHRGVDIPIPITTPLVAIDDGTVKDCRIPASIQ